MKISLERGELFAQTQTVSRMAGAILLTAFSVLAMTGAAGASSVPARRYPIIGCWSTKRLNDEPSYKPTVCNVIPYKDQRHPSKVEVAKLSHLSWSHWGARTATARGELTKCGSRCTTTSVRVEAYRRLAHAQPRVCGFGADYTRLKLTATNDRGETFSTVYTVTPALACAR